MKSTAYEGNKCVGRPQNYLSLQALYAVFTNKKSSILKEGRVPSKQLRSSGVLMEVNQVSCRMSHLLYLGCVPFLLRKLNAVMKKDLKELSFRAPSLF